MRTERGLEVKTFEKKEEIKAPFKYGIAEIRKKIGDNPEIEQKYRENILSFFPNVEDIEEFSKESPERFKEVLEKLKKFNPKAHIAELKGKLKIDDEELLRNLLATQQLFEIKKIERLEAPNRIIKEVIQELADRIITSNGILDEESFKKIIESIGKKGYDLRLLKAMIELSREPEAKNLVKDWDNIVLGEQLAFRERIDTKHWMGRLIDEKRIRKSREATQKIGEELEGVDINLKSNWDFGFRVRQKQIKEKILSEKENLRKIFEEYNLPKAVEGEELFKFVYLPPAWKESILSDDFRRKTKALGIKCESLSQLIETYKRLESRKFRKQKQREKVLERRS